MNGQKLRVAFLISGGGTTAQAIIRACKSGKLPNVEPACMISSKVGAGGIQKALDEGMDHRDITTLVPKKFPSPEDFGTEILNFCKKKSIDFMGQYGWLPHTPDVVIHEFNNRIINQHPGPLDPNNGRPQLDFGGPGMYGRRVHCARLYFLRETNQPPQNMYTEVVAHRVTREYDRGPIVKMRVVPINRYDTVESLQERALPEEHQVQIDALRDFAEGTVSELPARPVPLVPKYHAPMLEEAKHVAALLYPKG